MGTDPETHLPAKGKNAYNGRMDTKTPSELIDSLGGTTAVAKLCGLKNPQAVSNWRRNGIPAGWLRFLESVSSRDDERALAQAE